MVMQSELWRGCELMVSVTAQPDREELPVLSLHAQCPQCRSFDTRTTATMPMYGVAITDVRNQVAMQNGRHG